MKNQNQRKRNIWKTTTTVSSLKVRSRRYLFVEHIYHQHTLDRVVVDIAKDTDLKVAHRDPGEVATDFPFASIQQVFENVEPIEDVIGAEEYVQKEDLGDNVQYVENLYEDVKARHVGAPTATETKARNVGDFPLDFQCVLHVSGYRLDGRVSRISVHHSELKNTA